MTKRSLVPIAVLFLAVALPQSLFAMHIMEGFLPPVWCISWGAAALPFVAMGLYSIRRTVRRNPRLKLLIAMAGAFTFVLSALKIPSVTGSCSHPTGMGLGAILFGPTTMTALGLIVLLFQALLLAHGGLTTLGANLFSMGIVGPFASFGIYKALRKVGATRSISVFAASALGDLLTYVATSIQLALAFPAKTGIWDSLWKFMGIFAVTQIPLAVSEGILTVLVLNGIAAAGRDELKDLRWFKGEEGRA